MNRQKQYRTNVQVPKVWRRLIEEEFDQRSGGLFVTGTNREVRSEKHEHPTDDPDAYYDEVREVSGTFENGVRYRLQLCSGQSNYYAGIILDTSTEVIYEDDDPMETFHDPLILDGADDCQYTLNICWTGDDPYENRSLGRPRPDRSVPSNDVPLDGRTGSREGRVASQVPSP